MKQHSEKRNNKVEVYKTGVITMNVKEAKSLLPKKQVAGAKVKGMRN